MKPLKIIIVTLLSLSMLTGIALADEGGHGVHSLADSKTTIPSDAKGIWSKINSTQKLLEKTVKTGELSGVHKLAFEIRDLAEALPPVSSTFIPENKRGQFRTFLQRIDSEAKNLDKYGDAGNAEKTKKALARFKLRILQIANLYPEEISAAMDESHHDSHSGHDDGHSH